VRKRKPPGAGDAGRQRQNSFGCALDTRSLQQNQAFRIVPRNARSAYVIALRDDGRRVDLRVHRQDGLGKLKPTGKGLSFGADTASEILSALIDAQAALNGRRL